MTKGHDAWHDRFKALDAFLAGHQELWRPLPFTRLQLPWETRYPELAASLRSRSLQQAELSPSGLYELALPDPFPELARQARQLSHLDALPSMGRAVPEARLSRDVPGRKWEQIQHFAQSLDFAGPVTHWFDWCAGKGHLGRLLARDGSHLTCVERDPALVDAGRMLSERQRIQAEHVCVDVMDDAITSTLDADCTPIALHACGDLHVRLLHLATDAGCRQLAVSPCCYNRTSSDTHRPLSTVAGASRLRLTREDLTLIQRETAKAGARVRRQRDHMMAWRLGFDLLQREIRGVDAYLPVPSLSMDWLKKDFAQFCRDLAELKGLPHPGAADWNALEQAGGERLRQVRNLELVRALFRRPLEVWLLLDRAMLLEERGYRVRMGTFCPSALTPRNALILAER